MTILDNQRVEKRSGHRKNRSRLNNRSAGSNSDFMGLFDQHPVYKKKKRKNASGKQKEKSASKRQVHDERRSGGSEKPTVKLVLSTLATITFIAVTVVFAYTVLNWANLDIKTPKIYAFQLPENEEAGEQIIDYATLGSTSFLSPDEKATDGNAANTSSANSGDPKTRLTNEKESNHHGLLVTFEWREYIVKKGDVVSKIAENFNVSIGAIIASNEITNVRRIPEGKALRIPNIDGIPYKVVRGDNLSTIAHKFNVPLEVILDVNDLKSDVIKTGETLFIPGGRMNDIDLRLSLGDLFLFPLQTRKFITSYYGMRKDPKTGVLQFHAGVDFSANTGTTVMASMDGEVSVIGENWLYGKYIILSHPNGYKTLYGHLNAYSVKAVEKVTRCRKIAESGNTGYSTGPHLHFGIYDRNNKLINPLDLLN